MNSIIDKLDTIFPSRREVCYIISDINDLIRDNFDNITINYLKNNKYCYLEQETSDMLINFRSSIIQIMDKLETQDAKHQMLIISTVKGSVFLMKNITEDMIQYHNMIWVI